MYSQQNSSLEAVSELAQAFTAPATPSSKLAARLHNFALSAGIPNRTERPRSPEGSGEERPLEWHEVIELQAFSERKVWIEEKTRLLEQMPPIKVFVGLDAVRASAEEVPGLPTREELKQWLAEHDRIEKETEVFDSGELRKLKRITKAAAQRNLSPADTDLIELTLTTIYALDKLFHLLRDRSDSLELLSDRLTWEEKRISSWVELRSLLADLNNFLVTRARWSPTVYDRVHDEDETFAREFSPSPLPTLRRKSSISSLMSTASDSTISSLALSRGERFKLAETLSRDAAQFASRVSSLRHSKITSAGKALDKLIDDSRKPVPDELLDEQDKLEDKGINEMEDVGKFVMAVVMQWKKADEIYVETAKDKSTAQTLLEEIEIAKLNHPSSRQDNSFLSRSTALVKRLQMRENPSSPVSFFPRPTHPLFSDQERANDEIVDTLSAELAATQEQAHEAERAAKEYHATLDKVKKVDAISKTALDLTSQLESLSHRLEAGIESDAGDGTPPTLSSESCLHSNSHSVFLAHVPELLETASKIEQEATDVISSGRVALAALPRGGIDTKFVQDSVALLDRLASYRTSTINIRSSVASKVATLRQCRSIWSSMAETFDKVDNLRHDVVDNIQRQMYKPNSDQDAALLTPESPSSIIAPPELTAVQVNEQLDTLASALDTDITSPLSTVSRSIGPALNIYLSECSSGLKQSIEELKRLTNTWSLIQTQAAEMDAISDDVHAIQMRSEHIKLEFEDCTRDVLLGTLSGEDLSQKEVDLEAAVKQLTADVQAFQDKLSLRLPFVSSGNRPRVSATAPLPTRRRFSISTGFSLEVVRQAAQPGLPFDAAALDRAVRADANSYSILLAGEIESLTRSSTQFHLAQRARAIDVAVAGVSEALHEMATTLKTFQTRLREPEESCLLDHLQSLTAQVDEFYHEKGQALAASCLAARDLLERLGSESAGQDPSYDATILGPRRRAVEEAEEKFNSWRESVEVFSEQLSDMQHAERTRIEAEIAAQAAAEEAERLRLEEEERLRLEEEEKLRLEEEERRRVAEEERLRLEEEERLRLEKEERARLEEEQRRLAEEERMRLEEEERLRLAEEERLRLEEEERLRLAEEERLRLAEKEKERLRLKEAERLRVAEEEEEERRRLEEERLRAKEEERLRLEEQERQRLEEENRLRLEEEERLRLQEERRLRLEEEEERLRLQEEEMRLEEERLHREQAEEQHRVEMAILEQQKAEDTQKKAEADARAEAERKAEQEKRLSRKISKGKRHASPAHREDVFGISRTNSTDSTKSKEDIALQSVIVNLRKRLRSLNINEAVRGAASSLPSENTVSSIRQDLDALQVETNALPPSIPTAQYVDAELRSLRSELEASSEMLDRMSALSAFGAAVQKCDDLLSDLLEHIDSYPAPPLVTSSSLHATDTSCPPENQMSNRLMFTEGLIRAMMDQAHLIGNDSRVSSERNRIVQTWEELQAMGNDRVDGHKSRPPSALGSGSDRAGRASATPSPVPQPAKKGPSKKSAPYPGLSAAPPGGKYLAPPPSSRRSISRTSSAAPSRPSSRASTNRSVSGPTTTTPVATSRLYTSTFASRQRSSSITASIATIIESPSRPPPPPSNAARASGSRPRARTGQSSQVRTGSPLVTDVPRSRSRASAHAPRSSLSTKGPTWSRAPRQSFPNVPQSPPPRKPRSREKQPYVPNPDNKLDMAVGDVVNSLSANINIEVVADTWKDQSGKYWIGGDDDPKLCFCRILRSQTVMVRVGGGWVELSKFIKEHFADAFQILPVSESPPNKRAQGEKWISSVTLAQALSDKAQSPPLPPRTPEPQLPFVPTFALSTPGGTSPRTIKTSSPGSPLHAMQFIRRADPESLPARPETPTRAPRPSTSLSHNRRQPVWRP